MEVEKQASSQGKRYLETRADARFTGDRKATAVPSDDMLDQRKSEACSTNALPATPVKPFRQPRQMLPWYALTVIAHTQPGVGVIAND
jgi:hypothetical protein